MPDEPSGYELARNIEALRADVRSLAANTDSRIDRKVSSDTHAVEVRRIENRIDDIKQDIARIQAERERDRQMAQNAKQWAIGVGVTAAGVLGAYIAVIGDRL